MRLFGVLALLSFVGTYLYYTRALVSVWCFFAAVLSLIIYLHLRFRQMGGFPRLGTHHASADAPVWQPAPVGKAVGSSHEYLRLDIGDQQTHD